LNLITSHIQYSVGKLLFFPLKKSKKRSVVSRQQQLRNRSARRGFGEPELIDEPPVQQQQQQQTTRQDEHQANDELPPVSNGQYFVGDIVWFLDRSVIDVNNPYSYSGMVQELCGETLGIISLKDKIDGHDNHVFYVSKSLVFPDFCDLTLRFNRGICVQYNSRFNLVGERSQEDEWIPRRVEFLWPVTFFQHVSNRKALDVVPCYTCGDVIAIYDTDLYIRKQPTSFRLAVGDSVRVNADLARAKGRALKVLGLLMAGAKAW
jgi:hypothetical protein